MAVLSTQRADGGTVGNYLKINNYNINKFPQEGLEIAKGQEGKVNLGKGEQIQFQEHLKTLYESAATDNVTRHKPNTTQNFGDGEHHLIIGFIYPYDSNDHNDAKGLVKHKTYVVDFSSAVYSHADRTEDYKGAFANVMQQLLDQHLEPDDAFKLAKTIAYGVINDRIGVGHHGQSFGITDPPDEPADLVVEPARSEAPRQPSLPATRPAPPPVISLHEKALKDPRFKQYGEAAKKITGTIQAEIYADVKRIAGRAAALKRNQKANLMSDKAIADVVAGELKKLVTTPDKPYGAKSAKDGSLSYWLGEQLIKQFNTNQLKSVGIALIGGLDALTRDADDVIQPTGSRYYLNNKDSGQELPLQEKEKFLYRAENEKLFADYAKSQPHRLEPQKTHLGRANRIRTR